jgi:hypothetical protein
MVSAPTPRHTGDAALVLEQFVRLFDGRSHWLPWSRIVAQ